MSVAGGAGGFNGGSVEATAGFEPANRGFADPPLRPLGYVALLRVGCPSRIRTSVHGSKVRCPTTRRRGNDPSSPQRREWSGRRDSNPRPSHWQCDALPTEPLPHRSTFSGAESQIRTGDTALFRRVLYQLSYLGPTPAATRPYAPTAARIPSPAEGRNEAPRGRLLGCWWAVRGSNPRPPRCKRGALPTELTARVWLRPVAVSRRDVVPRPGLEPG